MTATYLESSRVGPCMALADMSWTDAHDADIDVVLLPVGSTEQHGPHAPLGTDWMLAEAVADRGADASDADVIVAPTLPIGISEEHRAFAGTLWVSPDTFRDMIRETVQSLAHHGWDRVIVVNGHGGNADALGEIAADITRGGGTTCVPFTWFQSIDLPADTPMGHAGAVETAGVMAIRPELVHPDRLAEASAQAAERWGKWVAGVNLAIDSDEFSENGVVGDPTVADAELGESILQEAENALVELIGAVISRD